MNMVSNSSTGGRVSGRDARRLVSEHRATLVDVRSPAEFGMGHADGALNIPVQVLQGRMSDIPRDRPVVVYCASGARSANAAALLSAEGYKAFDAGGLHNMRG